MDAYLIWIHKPKCDGLASLTSDRSILKSSRIIFFLATRQYRGTNQLPLRRKGFSSDINTGGGRVEAAKWALSRAEQSTA